LPELFNRRFRFKAAAGRKKSDPPSRGCPEGGKKPGERRFALKASPCGHSEFDLAARIS
jgi:hypothetical protein